MTSMMKSINKVTVSGKIVGKIIQTHELFGERFFELNLEAPRLSDTSDLLPITISERLLLQGCLASGDEITIKGQLRSYNKIEGNKSKLILTIFAREAYESDGKICNNIEMSGFICKPPVYRTTPFNREICDLLIAVNRSYGKSDYIPAIAWGRNARFVKFLNVGEQIVVGGRVQSRVYQKRLSDTLTEERIAYEVSAGRILVGDSATEFIHNTIISDNPALGKLNLAP